MRTHFFGALYLCGTGRSTRVCVSQRWIHGLVETPPHTPRRGRRYRAMGSGRGSDCV